MRQIDWYFDFISPFAYLAFEKLPHVLPHNVQVNYKPVLFAGLLKHWGQLGPAEIPPKRHFTFAHCAWLAHTQGIAIKLPAQHPFNPLPLLRAALAAGGERNVIAELFSLVWQQGQLPLDSAGQAQLGFAEFLSEYALTLDDLNHAEIKAQLNANGAAAIQAGVFGVPTAVLDGHTFWGLDALPMLADYLSDSTFFKSDLLRSAQALPQGQNRLR